MHNTPLIAPTPHVLGVGLAMLLGLAGSAHAGPLNDTGVEYCRTHEPRYEDRTQTAVTATTTCEKMPVHGGEDARYGRDAAAVKGQLTKAGASTPVQVGVDGAGNPITQANGFDFTKISNSGAKLPATATLGTGPDDWGCTYDNNTGLLWEVKTYDEAPANKGLRDVAWTYVWHNPDRTYRPTQASTDGDGAKCYAIGTCDTVQYTAAVNKAGLCGKSDWRMPTRLELHNLVDYGRPAPMIDPMYFPNTLGPRFEGTYWTGTSYAMRHTSAKHSVAFVNFDYVSSNVKGEPFIARSVRLVRNGL
ncbi:DUF1566 domain-containing protein [Ottowia sp. SB7-C50]|uniref:Lcl C-terminal domain-containing protein n=1 Tax=Ottowia sp. SB7-C50 TaxID=3081231 RepID=UPI00295528DA|nr:DUF1566 domain-containing protein [Ottowia sp. SB7-C50]WOP14379.1 DUF1566 domain-containing protein [Ottowia sp. SB7-C50]